MTRPRRRWSLATLSMRMPVIRRRLSTRPVIGVLAVTALTLTALATSMAARPARRNAAVTAGHTSSLVFAVFGPQADRIYVAPPGAPDQRRQVAEVPHAEGWGINPAPALAGTLAAFTALPPGSVPQRDTPAELWLLEAPTGRLTRVATDADLLAPPVFDATGTSLVYRRSDSSGAQSIVRVAVHTLERDSVLTAKAGFGLYPIGFARDGGLLYFVLATTGTDLYRVATGEQPRLLLHASDEIARDWRIAPDGQRLSYLAPESVAERVVHRLHVVDIDTHGAPRRNSTPLASQAPAAGEQFGGVWTPDSGAITVGREPYQDARADALTLSLGDSAARTVAGPARGFDVPLAWSSDGQYLAARSFDGTTSHEPGTEQIVVLSNAGQRTAIAAQSDVIFMGWLTGE